MSLGTVTKTGFSVRDILDLPGPKESRSTGANDAEEDDAEEASTGAESAQKLGLGGRSLCERSGGSFGRWSRGSGDLHFSREQSFPFFKIKKKKENPS